MKGVSPNQTTFLLKSKCVKYGLVQKLIHKLISHIDFEVPDGKKFTHLNENLYWHLNHLTAYVQFMPHFQIDLCLKRPETFIHNTKPLSFN